MTGRSMDTNGLAPKRPRLEWKIRTPTTGQETPVRGGIETLQEMAASGKLLAEHYVYNPILEKWLYARDLAELKSSFRAPQAMSAKNFGAALVFLALPLYFVTGGIAAGVLAGIGILVFAVAATQGK